MSFYICFISILWCITILQILTIPKIFFHLLKIWKRSFKLRIGLFVDSPWSLSAGNFFKTCLNRRLKLTCRCSVMIIYRNYTWSTALCSRNFQNVKLRLDSFEIWSDYRHSNFTWNQILVNSHGPKMSFCGNFRDSEL